MDYFKLGKTYIHQTERRQGVFRKYTLIEKTSKVHIFLGDSPTPIKWTIPNFNTEIFNKFMLYDPEQHTPIPERDSVYRTKGKNKQRDVAKLLSKTYG